MLNRTMIPSLVLLLTLMSSCAPPPTATLPPTPVVTPIPQLTPEQPGALPGLEEIADPPGEAYPWARFTRTPRLALDPLSGTALAAWLSWNHGADDYAGDVWVRLQDPHVGVWGQAETINTAPVSKFYGGLGVAITPDGTAAVAYGHGNFNGNQDIVLVERRAADTAWSAPAALPLRGRVIDLLADSAGGLHLLAIRPDDQGASAVYAYRAPGTTRWEVHADLPGPAPEHAALALLQTGATLQRVVLLVRGNQVAVARSADGAHWQAQALETDRYFASEVIVATSLVAAARLHGDLIAAAWSQIPGPGHARGGVFAVVSLDGGTTWSREEIIALHNADGRLDPLAGFDPTLVYDASTDMLIASWNEDDVAQRSASGGAQDRVLIAGRRLTGDQGWRYARTPRNGDQPRPELAGWGFNGWLYSTPTGTHHWLLLLELRNGQNQLLAKPLRLSFLFAEGVS